MHLSHRTSIANLRFPGPTARGLRLVAAAALIFLVTPLAARAADGPKSREADRLVVEGVRMFDAGDREGAVELYRKALRLDPRHVEANYELGHAQLALGDWDGCLESAERVLALDPPPAIEALTFSLAGSCLSSAGKPRKALARFRRGLERYPDDPMLHFNMAVTLLTGGDNEEAIGHLERAADAAPDYPSPYYLLGEAMSREGHRAASLLYIVRFVALEPIGERARQASRSVFGLVRSGISEDAPGQITMTVPSAGEDDPFSPMEMMLSVSSAHLFLEPDEDAKDEAPPTPADRHVKVISTFVTIISEGDSDPPPGGAGFQRRAVEPLLELSEKDHLESLLYVMAAHAGLEGAEAWLAGHEEELVALERSLGKPVR